MKSDLEFGWSNGIVIRNDKKRFVFDPTDKSSIHKGDSIFITHSHADHMSGFNSSEIKYSTEATKEIYEEISGKKVSNFIPITINQSINFGDLKVIPLNAGHMLGSVQYKIDTPNSSILYTGDINCVNTLITEKADEIECDTLIIEATFGNPAYVFPKRENVYIDIIKWAMERLKEEKIPVFQAYAAGKAQELIKIFNDFTNLRILTHPKISKINKVYSEKGVKLEHFEISDESIDFNKSIYLTTYTKNRLNFKNEEKAVTTGWVVNGSFNSMQGFPLSGHADFKQLTRFVKNTGARTVYIYTGFKKSFSNYLCKKFSVNAKPLPLLPPRNLKEFLF